MPVNLVTGLPGHGKTLYALWMVEARRKAENRSVYVHGVPELTLEWEELDDPQQWYTLPEGSIVLIDECQRVFPTRKNGSSVPQYVSEFETHRHRGLDIYIITQAPTFIDAHLRKLVDRHFHVMRPFGHSYAVIFEWQYVVPDPMRDSQHKHAIKKRWKHAKEVYGWYKSSTQHTVQKRVPWKVVALPVMAGLVTLLVFSAKRTLSPDEQLATPARSKVDAVNIVPANGVDVPDGMLALVEQLRREPLGEHGLYVAARIEMGDRSETWFSAERDGRSMTVTWGELEGMGYVVESLGDCVVRLAFGARVRYAYCRGLGEGQRERPRLEYEGNGGLSRSRGQPVELPPLVARSG